MILCFILDYIYAISQPYFLFKREGNVNFAIRSVKFQQFFVSEIRLGGLTVINGPNLNICRLILERVDTNSGGGS